MEVFINLLVNGVSNRDAYFPSGCWTYFNFGLMNVLNFAHGGLFVWGAFSGAWIFKETNSFLLARVVVPL